MACTSSSLRLHLAVRCRRTPLWATPSMRFFSPSTHAERSASTFAVPTPRGPAVDAPLRVRRCRTARAGFSRPLRASSRSLPGLFHPGSAHGVFALQRSVRALGRTPLGWPCPSFPWPRARRLAGVVHRSMPSPRRSRGCGSCRAASRAVGALVVGLPLDQRRPWTGWRDPWRSFLSATRHPCWGVPLVPFTPPRPKACRDPRISAQVRARGSEAVFHRVRKLAPLLGFLPSRGSWPTLDRISPITPLSPLAVPHGPLPEPQGIDRSST
jgi:hypothetical protein